MSVEDVGELTAVEVSEQPDALLAREVEAVLIVADEPVTEEQLALVLERPIQEVHDVVDALCGEYASRGFELRQVAGGWRFYSRAEHADVVRSFVLDSPASRLSQAALETLAVVAYRQPVTRGRIAGIRGVNVDSPVKTLLNRGLIEVCGKDESSGSVLYATTGYFLEVLNLNTLDELPHLAPYLPDGLDSEVLLERADEL